MPEACTVTSDGTVLLSVHVQPGARHTAVAGFHGDAVKLRVAAPAEAGRANDAVRHLVASVLGARPADIVIVSGATSRRKRLALHNVAPTTVAAWLATLPTP